MWNYNYTYSYPNELYHYGVLGMKWGVRRYQNPDGSLTSKGKKRYAHNSEKKDRKEAYKNRRTLSDREIQKRIERLRLEKQFKDLTENDLYKGRKFIRDILYPALKKTLTVATAGAIAYGMKALMTKNFNLQEAAKYIAYNPNKK